MKSKSSGSLQRAIRSSVLLVIVLLGTLISFRKLAHSYDVDVDSQGSLQYFGSRKVFYMSTWQLYWVFYQDTNGNLAYDCFDKNGVNRNRLFS